MPVFGPQGAVKGPSALLANLVLYCSLTEPTGTPRYYDASKNGNSMTPASFAVPPSFPVSGTGLVYPTATNCPSGALAYGFVPNSTAAGGTFDFGGVSFTAMVWMNLNSTGADRTVLGRLNGSVPGGWFIDHQNSQGISLYFRAVGNPLENVAGPTFTSGSWHLVFGWYDLGAGTMNIQADNGSVTSAAVAPLVSAASNFVGLAFNPAGGYDGLVGPIALWKGRVLSSLERGALWNGGAGLRLL